MEAAAQQRDKQQNFPSGAVVYLTLFVSRQWGRGLEVDGKWVAFNCHTRTPGSWDPSKAYILQMQDLFFSALGVLSENKICYVDFVGKFVFFNFVLKRCSPDRHSFRDKRKSKRSVKNLCFFHFAL